MDIETDFLDVTPAPQSNGPDQLPCSPSPPPALTETGRPKRSYRVPARYEDVPPVGPAPLPSSPSSAPMPPGSLALPRVILHVRDSIRTGINSFGILREYPYRPSHDPDTFVPDEELSNFPRSEHAHQALPAPTFRAPPWPFQNMSIYLLMEWMITGNNQKSVGEMDRLAKDVIGSKDFNVGDIEGFSARQENKHLDECEQEDFATPYSHDGWVESNVQISIPTGLKDKNGLGQQFSVPGLQHRSIFAIMKAALTDITSRRFHFSPFKRIFKSSTGSEERCFDEAYTSNAWLEAHHKLQRQSNEPGCKIEKVILGLMFWWPLYLYFGNLSKYFRGKPSSGASHHVAYIPSVRVSVTNLIYPQT